MMAHGGDLKSGFGLLVRVASMDAPLLVQVS